MTEQENTYTFVLEFKGGPWDGVSFEAALAPDCIHLRDMQIHGEHTGKGIRMTTAIREHNVYLISNVADPNESDLAFVEYTYQKDGKPYWDVQD